MNLEISPNEIVQQRINIWKEQNKKKKFPAPLDLTGLKVEKYEGIPDTVTHLICDKNTALKTLEGLPDSIKRLNFDNYPLTEINHLPPNLEYLECNLSRIEVLDILPNSIKKIKIKEYSKLHTIKSLPPGLRELDISYDEYLTSIECEFPPTLRVLDLRHTYLEEIPTLPESLTKLDITKTHIHAITKFPKNLKVLMMWGTNIKKIPELPKGLLCIHFDTAKQLEDCRLPNTIKEFDCRELELKNNIYTNFNKHIPYKGSPWATTPVEQSRENTEGNIIE